MAKVRVMAKGEIPSPPEQEGEEECLHCAIVALVEARIAAGDADAANLAALIVESLVDLILRVPEEEQAQLLAHTLSALAAILAPAASAFLPAIPDDGIPIMVGLFPVSYTHLTLPTILRV